MDRWLSFPWLHHEARKGLGYQQVPWSHHYKKPVFFCHVQNDAGYRPKKHGWCPQKTLPKIQSTETCKKLGKNCTRHGQCLPGRAHANIPVYGSCYPHVWKLTCPRLPTNISMLFTMSRSFWCSSTFLFWKCWCPAKRLRFLVTSQKTRVSYSAHVRLKSGKVISLLITCSIGPKFWTHFDQEKKLLSCGQFGTKR